MTIDIAKSGETSAEHNGIRIHSAYDPRKEAGRFLDSALPAGTRPNTIIVIGAGLGYADETAAERWPNADIIAIHLNAELYKNRIGRSRGKSAGRIKRWHPESDVSLPSFLASAVGEHNVHGLHIIQWPASVSVMPDEANRAAQYVAQIVRRHTGSITATAAFGRLWIRNTLRNFIELDRLAVPSATDKPVVIAASGPGLEYALTYLSTYRGRFRLWALPSALPALSAASLTPDLIFATDSGHWAKLHMRYFPPSVPVVMPLSAAPPPSGIGVPMLIRQGVPGESRLLRGPEWPLLPIPARGTVAATAVDVWSAAAGDSLLLVGLDLCWYDLRSHARPHAFDGWIASRTDRKNPKVNELWNRALAQAPKKEGKRRTGPALETYADWFRGIDGKGRIFRFHSPENPVEPVSVEGFPIRGEELFREWKSSGTTAKIAPYRITEAPQNRLTRKKAVISLLDDWKKRLETKTAADEDEDDFHEMLYTLDPGGTLELTGASDSEKKRIASEHFTRVGRILDKIRDSYV